VVKSRGYFDLGRELSGQYTEKSGFEFVASIPYPTEDNPYWQAIWKLKILSKTSFLCLACGMGPITNECPEIS
jgi:hypothetical protein